MQTPLSRTIPTAALAGALGLLALIGLLVLAPPAAAKTKFKVEGRGYGHGVGMSQWGAYGYAKRGVGHKKILRHYYQGTDIGAAGGRKIKVLLSTRPRDVAFSGAKRACGRKLSPSKTYRAKLASSSVRLEKAGGGKLTSCGDALRATPRGKITIGGDGVYRGKLVARQSGGALNVINSVSLDDYIQGVVPGEVPASWPPAALRAQAIAARSYALATDANGAGFDQYDDTRSQVYEGLESETARTNQAVADTALQVVLYKGEVAETYYFSTSGGHTENNEFSSLGFGGTPYPYLRGVPDPYDDASPYHRWTRKFSVGRMQSLLGDLVRGRLKRIVVTKTGASPRIVKAKLVGSGGVSKVTGPTLQSNLGLPDTWATSFKRK